MSMGLVGFHLQDKTANEGKGHCKLGGLAPGSEGKQEGSARLGSR